MTVSERVVRYIVDNKMDTKMLSEAIGVSETAINYWKRGRNLPNRNTVKKILIEFPEIEEYLSYYKRNKHEKPPITVSDASARYLSNNKNSSEILREKIKFIQYQSRIIREAANHLNEIINSIINDSDDETF